MIAVVSIGGFFSNIRTPCCSHRDAKPQPYRNVIHLRPPAMPPTWQTHLLDSPFMPGLLMLIFSLWLQFWPHLPRLMSAPCQSNVSDGLPVQRLVLQVQSTNIESSVKESLDYSTAATSTLTPCRSVITSVLILAPCLEHKSMRGHHDNINNANPPAAALTAPSLIDV